MFRFLLLINNSVTVGLTFLLGSISTIVTSYTNNIFHFLFVFFTIFINSIHIIQVLNIASELLKSLMPAPSSSLIKNWYFASYGSLIYK